MQFVFILEFVLEFFICIHFSSLIKFSRLNAICAAKNRPLMSILAIPIGKETTLEVRASAHPKNANIFEEHEGGELGGGLSYSEEVAGDYSGAA